jgi:hypothetical protein
MADEKNVKKNPMAEAANWNARCITEEEAPHKWNESWGTMFTNNIPHNYVERIEYLENELESYSPVEMPPKYGVGPAFPKFGAPDYRKKPFNPPTTFTDEELDEVIRRKKKGQD